MDVDAPIINRTIRYGVIIPMSDSEVTHSIRLAEGTNDTSQTFWLTGGISDDPSQTFYRQYVGDGAPREGFDDIEKADWLANDYLGGPNGRVKARIAVITHTVERYSDGKIIETRVLEVFQG